MTDIDKTDRKFLLHLDQDARQSVSQIAKEIHVSKQVARYRQKRLEETGIIRGYYPVIDVTTIGYTLYRVYIKFANTQKSQREKIIQIISNVPEVWAIVTFAGKWDLALGIAVTNPLEFQRVWKQIQTAHQSHIQDTAVHGYGPIRYFSRAYLEPSEKVRMDTRVGTHNAQSIDEKDWEILQALATDASMSVTDIAKQVHLAIESVRVRLKQLQQKNILLGCRPIIDIRKLGFNTYKAEIQVGDMDKLLAMEEFCHMHTNIVEIDGNIGGAPLEFVVHAESLDAFIQVMDEFEAQFSESIQSWDFLTVLDEIQLTYLPQNSSL